MEMIVVGETLLPSGRPIERLFLISQPAVLTAHQMLVANDGIAVYMRFYPSYPDSDDTWGVVGPVEPISPEGDAAFGYHRVELETFNKDA